MFCANCGKEINKETSICSHCAAETESSGLAQTENEEDYTAEQPVVISRKIRTVFEKSTRSTIGSCFAILGGSVLLPILLLVLFYRGDISESPMDSRIGMMGIVCLFAYPFAMGIQTLLSRRKIELTPDGLYYSNYEKAKDWPQCYLSIESSKDSLLWKEIHSIEVKEGRLNLQKRLREGLEEEHSLSLAGFDAPAKNIYANVLDYYRRYKNGYTLLPDSAGQTRSAFQWNKSATWILLLCSSYFGTLFLFDSDFFNELGMVKSFDQFLDKTCIDFCERTGVNNAGENTVARLCFFYQVLIYSVPFVLLWFFIVRTMWKAIPSDIRRLNPYLAAFLSIIPLFCYVFNFIVLRGWAECLNKAAGRNGQRNICIVDIANLFCFLILLINLFDFVIGAISNGDIEKYLGVRQELCLGITGIIIRAVFLLYVVNGVRRLNPPQSEQEEFDTAETNS
ncbi:MAG: hypothetical protein LBQ50_14830 [Planctomycetaceae bacterium]|jgi:hypothetical protein|nr:hypothetical protein [Planctomycetaceae bacterium]